MSLESDEFSDIDIKGSRLESGAGRNDQVQDDALPHAYKKRWIILAVLSLAITINSCCINLIGDFQTNVEIFYRRVIPASIYPGESSFYLGHVVLDLGFTLTAAVFLEAKGLRTTCLIGITLSCLGSWIRCATINDKMYSILFAGLVLCGLGQIYMTSAVFYLSACWFTHKETAVAISIGLSSSRLGAVLAIVFRMFFENNPSYRNFNHPYYESLFISVMTTISLGFAIVLIRDDPIRAPSIAQCQIRKLKDQTMTSNDSKSKLILTGRACQKILSSWSFIQLTASFAVLIGVMSSKFLLLKPLLIEQQRFGQFNLELAIASILISGIIGSVSSGILLGFTKIFKLLLCLSYGIAIISVIGFVATVGLYNCIPIVFLAIFGFLVAAYEPVGYEFGVELTYPRSVTITCLFLNMCSLIMTAIIKCIEKATIGKPFLLFFNLILVLLLVTGFLLAVFLPKDLRRQEANENRGKIEPD